jgi:hypothetical protein
MLKTFGQLVTVGGESVQGLLDKDYLPVQFGNQVIESSAPVLLVRTEDVTVSHGTPVTIGDEDYTVREVRPDGEGMTDLVLSVAS